MIGKTISHYRILEKLGEGGMGVVYKAQDTKLDRLVAIKFLPQHLTSDSVEKERFVHEAKAASALNHTNVATIHEIDEFEGQMFIVMEYCEGKTLRQIIEKETLSVKKVLDIGIQICEGLTIAHEKGIVHRDIKSDNIMLTPRGQVKIMDFGLAKLKGATKLTKTRSTLGTAAYMSPEQAQGEEVDSRSDIFSFGVVLYELLTGRLPFEGEHQAAIIYSIINEEPQPVGRFNNQVSTKLEDMVFKALAKEKEERYQHIDDLLADLRRERKSLEYVKTAVTTQPAESPKIVKKKTLPLVVGVLAVLLLVVGYFAFFNQREPDTTVTGKPSIAVLYLQNLSENKEDEYFAAGMTEDIITQLSKIGGLRVASRSEIEQFKDKPVNIKAVAEKLKVDYVMEGSVRKYGNKFRITCQLIQADDGFHVWADNYDRQLEDLFAIQADVAKEVAKALEVALAPVEKEKIEQVPTANLQAYDFYLRGRQYMYQRSKSDNLLATQMFQRAIELDSLFADGYIFLGYSYAQRSDWGFDMDPKWLDEAERAIRKGIQLDETNPWGYGHLADVYLMRGKPKEAIEALEKALKLRPDDYELNYWMAPVHFDSPGFGRAREYLERSLALKPNYPEPHRFLGKMFHALGKPDQAETHYRKAVELGPDFAHLHRALGSFYLQRGRFDEAREQWQTTIRLKPDMWVYKYLLGFTELLAGNTSTALRLLENCVKNEPEPEYYLGLGFAYEKVGEMSKMQEAFQKALKGYRKLVEQWPQNVEYHTRSAYLLARLGDVEKARQHLKTAERLIADKNPFVQNEIKIRMAAANLAMSDTRSALNYIAEIVNDNFYAPTYIWADPYFDSLHDSPEFRKLVRREEK